MGCPTPGLLGKPPPPRAHTNVCGGAYDLKADILLSRISLSCTLPAWPSNRSDAATVLSFLKNHASTCNFALFVGHTAVATLAGRLTDWVSAVSPERGTLGSRRPIGGLSLERTDESCHQGLSNSPPPGPPRDASPSWHRGTHLPHWSPRGDGRPAAAAHWPVEQSRYWPARAWGEADTSALAPARRSADSHRGKGGRGVRPVGACFGGGPWIAASETPPRQRSDGCARPKGLWEGGGALWVRDATAGEEGAALVAAAVSRPVGPRAVAVPLPAGARARVAACCHWDAPPVGPRRRRRQRCCRSRRCRCCRRRRRRSRR